MDEELNKPVEENAIDIHPLKKGRRILVFLADFFMHFILSFLLFNIAIAPIGKAITNYTKQNEDHITLTYQMYDHYYKSGLLLKNETFETNDVTAGIEYTYRCFLSYFVLDNEESIDSSNPQYGHKIQNNVIYHFYHDIRNNDNGYITSFKAYNEKQNYFNYDESLKSFSLKNEVKTELYAFYDIKDELGKVGKTYYNNIMKDVFNPMLAEIFTDINKNDLHYEGEELSYLECKNKVKSIESYHDNLMTICVCVSHVVSWLALFVVVPLVNKNRKTLAAIFLKVEIVNFYSLNHQSRKMYILVAIYSFFAMMLGMMFVPSLLVPFNNLFALRYLVYATVFSLVLIIADLIFLLINQYNRSLVDFLANNLYLSEEDMNELYRAKGYKI